MGAPTTQRHATSSAVSEGRRNTQPIWPTMDWVPRTGRVIILLDDKIHSLSGHDDDLGYGFTGDAGLNLFIRERGGLNDFRRRARGHMHNVDEFSVNPHRNFKFVFFRETRI